MRWTGSSATRAGAAPHGRGLAGRPTGLVHLVAVVFLLAGCGEQLVELPLDRRAAVPVALAEGPLRCPANTVLLTDDDPASGAGAVPVDFYVDTVLRCDVDYQATRNSGSLTYVTVRQWQRAMKSQLRESLELPDRALRPAVACASGSTRTTAVYLVDRRRQAVRVLLPTDQPCSKIRSEVAALLPADGSAIATTFQASQPNR